MHDIRLAYQFAFLWSRFTLLDWRNFAFSIVGLSVQVGVLCRVWSSLDEPQFAVLTGISVFHAWVGTATVSRWIQRRVYFGEASYDLTRPGGLLRTYAAIQAGYSIPYLAVGLAGVFVLGFSFRTEPTLVTLVCYGLSAILGLIVASTIGIMFGLCAFWLKQIAGINTVFRLAVQFFAGAVVPLAAMPTWLRAIAESLPFQATATVPAEILTSAVPNLRLLAEQAAWCVILGAGCVLVARRARVHGSALGG